MNSDPYDSAAWRAFGMLDSDESELFDEAARTDPGLNAAAREMNGVAAAIAAACATPLLPKAGQLERIHARVLEGRRPRRRFHPIFAYAGWGVAAALACVLLLRGAPKPPAPIAETDAPRHPAPPKSDVYRPEASPPHGDSEDPASVSRAMQPAPDVVTGLAQARSATRAETKRLVQEIEVLRDNLERFQQRDRAVFETVPGRAWPIVMSMSPPGMPVEETQALALADDPYRITTMLGDALAHAQRSTMGAALAPGDDPLMRTSLAPGETSPAAQIQPEHPSAIPIYDAARDTGTLVVSKLPPAPRGEAYNLWVTTENGGAPIFVGSLPVSNNEVADSFDFSLGSNMVLPTGFVLTRDPIPSPTRPGPDNTVLLGPPSAAVE